jgi:hypothetical protein
VDGERKVDIVISSQMLYGTINGTIRSILGLCGKTYAFLTALQRAMDAIVKPVGNLSHAHYWAWRRDETRHGTCGFVDRDWIKKFLDLDCPTMDRVIGEINANLRWSTCNNGKGFGARDNVRQTLIDMDEGMGADLPLSASNVRTLSVEDVLGSVKELPCCIRLFCFQTLLIKIYSCSPTLLTIMFIYVHRAMSRIPPTTLTSPKSTTTLIPPPSMPSAHPRHGSLYPPVQSFLPLVSWTWRCVSGGNCSTPPGPQSAIRARTRQPHSQWRQWRTSGTSQPTTVFPV